MRIDNDLLLQDLEDEILDTILSLREMDKTRYFSSLIEKFFPHVEKDSEEYETLQLSYRASFVLEKLYRETPLIYETFTIVYSKQGLIRDIISDLYFTDDTLVTH